MTLDEVRESSRDRLITAAQRAERAGFDGRPNSTAPTEHIWICSFLSPNSTGATMATYGGDHRNAAATASCSNSSMRVRAATKPLRSLSAVRLSPERWGIDGPLDIARFYIAQQPDARSCQGRLHRHVICGTFARSRGRSPEGRTLASYLHRTRSQRLSPGSAPPARSCRLFRKGRAPEPSLLDGLRSITSSTAPTIEGSHHDGIEACHRRSECHCDRSYA